MINLDHRYRVGDRVRRNGVRGTVLDCKILVNMSADTPAVLAYHVAFDDGRRLTVEEAALDSILESMSVENAPDLSC